MRKLKKIVAVACFLLCGTLCLWTAQSAALREYAASQTVKEASKAEAVDLNREGKERVAAKQYDQAKALFNRAIALDPKLSDAYENLALLLLLEGDDNTAERTALKLLALMPDNYNARLVAGVAAINRKDFLRGRDDLAPLVSNSAGDPIVTAAYAVALEAIGRKAEAAAVSQGLTGLRLEASDALLAGQIYREPRLKKVAQKWLEESIASAGARINPELLYMLASIYADQGRRKDAAILYKRVLGAAPGNVDALVELSEVERILGEEQQATSHLYEAKTLAATDVSTLLHFGQICMRRRMYVDARDALKQVVAQDARNRHAWYQLGLAQFRIGETEDAEKDFKTALGLDAYDEWARVGLGAVMVSTGHLPEAAAEFRRVLQRDPGSAPAHYYLGQIHRNKGEIPLAIRELQLAANEAQEDPRPLAALGQLQLAQHDFAAARVSLDKAIRLDPDYAVAHYHLAMLLKTTGEQAAAAKELELFQRCHEEEKKRGIIGLVSGGNWDYVGFLPSN